MGRRGPAPDPTALKLLRGNPGRRPINGDNPQPQVGAGKPPTWLDRAAKAHWKTLAPDFERVGVLTIIDRPAFTLLCHAWSEWHKAVRLMAGEDVVFVAESGYTQVTGYVTLERLRKRDYQQLAAKFGLTPASRANFRTI